MRSQRIKIGNQSQADLPIYLTSSGCLICGALDYRQSNAAHLKELYFKIHELVGAGNEDLDVSQYRYWNALNIYEEHIAVPWNKSLSAEFLEKLSIETQVFLMLKPVRELFKKAVARRWCRIFRASNPDDPNRPTQAWQILKTAEQVVPPND
jgi:hypothetical protein